MKIGPLDPKPSAAQATPATTERKSGAAPAARGAAEPSAQVALSSQAAALIGSPGSTAVSGNGGDGSFDPQKVERIAQAIRDGQFRVNPEAIADKLIANAQELLGRAGRAPGSGS